MKDGAEILSIGDEVVRGQITDTNAAWLGRRLADLGRAVRGFQAVPDDPAAIGRALLLAGGRSRIVMVTGGLGPTSDDLTIAAAAGAFGLPLARDPGVLASIRAFFSGHGRAMPESNAKQADLPAGATIIENPRGTAPGCRVDHDGTAYFFLPGPPAENRPMFDASVAGVLRELLPGPAPEVRALRVFGLPESAIAELLAPLERSLPATDAPFFRIAYRIVIPEIEVKLVSSHPEPGRNAALGRLMRDRAVSLLGENLVGEGDVSLPEAVSTLLRNRGLTLAVAESCTGGLIGKLLTDLPGSSAFFRGGVVAYHNDLKEGLLGVAARTLSEHGAVSGPVVEEMAAGARRILKSDLGLSVSGIAGPDGGTAEKPVGTVYIGLADDRGVRHHGHRFRGDRDAVRIRAAFHALFDLRNALGGNAGSFP